MKRLLISILLIGLLFGCAGISANAPVSATLDTAFYLALKNNPQYKSQVVVGLTATKVFLSGSVTYDQLIAEITKQFSGDYAAIGIILSGYVSTDKPISTNLFPMSDAYKSAIIMEIDKFLLLASTIKG